MDNEKIGEIVYSKSGRDKDNIFLIVGVLDENYAYISDGKLRKIDKPKKKKVKHLDFTGKVAYEFREKMLNGEMISNSKIRIYLNSEDANKEV